MKCQRLTQEQTQQNMGILISAWHQHSKVQYFEQSMREHVLTATDESVVVVGRVQLQ